ncbi:MAG: FIST C-terminal domain-containing protein [Candidatus Doudnabacteria bacterium]
MSLDSSKLEGTELALLISCVGRKLVLKEKIEEEVEAVQSALGGQAAITGFYSYGEISPVTALNQQCQLHNQTMTVTIFKEV